MQIPCFNEASTLPLVLAGIPSHIAGVDVIETLVIDDGSSDGTSEVARSLGVTHVIRHRRNRGLAAAFASGIDACLRLGADIIVNTDGDNQYCQADIATLIDPLLSGAADTVVGDRQVSGIAEFSQRKRWLSGLGSAVVRRLSNTSVPDAPSGFRAYTREAASRINVLSSYSYTLETLIQAGAQRMAVAHVPIRTNPKLRESRLFGSIGGYVKRSGATIVRSYATYQPLKVFFTIGMLILGVGLAVVARFLYFYAAGSGSGHIQSLVLAVALIVVGFQVGLIGLLADLIAANRRLLEETLYRLRRLESVSPSAPGSLEPGADDIHDGNDDSDRPG